MNDVRYKVSRIVKLVETVEIKVECHFYFYYAFSMAAKGKIGQKLGPSTESHENWWKCSLCE